MTGLQNQLQGFDSSWTCKAINYAVMSFSGNKMKANYYYYDSDIGDFYSNFLYNKCQINN